MASVAKLVVALGANISDFETDMKRASTMSKREFAKMERDAKRLNDTWNRNFKLAGAAVAAGLALAAKSAAEFEKSMAEVSTLLDDTGGLDRLSDSVKDLSVQFGQAPTVQARALYQIISAGASDSATQIELLTASNKLAVGGITDVATAADGLTSVLNAYSGSGLDAKTASDVLFSTMKAGKTTIGELSQSLGSVVTIASQTGVSFQELGAAVATVTKVGLNTNQAVEGLRGVLAAVLKETDKSKKAAKELGIEFNVAALQSKGFAKFLQEIADSGATEAQLQALIGRVEGLTVFMAAARNGGKEFNKILEDIKNQSGITEEALAKITGTTAFKVDQAKAAFEALKIEIGTRFLSGISGAATAFVKNIDEIIRAVEVMVAFIAGRATIAVVASFAQMAAAGKSAATAMAILGGAAGASATALGAVAAIYFRNVDIQNRMADSLGNLKTVLEGVTDEWIQNANAADLAVVSQAVVQSQADAADRLVVIAENLAQLQQNFGSAVDQLQFSSQFQELTQEIADLTEGINVADSILEKIGRTSIGSSQAIAGFVDDILAASDAAGEAADELEDYEKKLQAILDALNPVAAEARDLADTLEVLTVAQRKGDLTWDQYRKAVEQATAKFGKAVDELRGITKASEDAARAQQKLIDASQAVIDQLDEGGAIQRQFIRDLEDLKAGFDEAESGGLTLDEAIRRLTENYYRAIAASEGLAIGSRNVADELGKTGDAAKRAAAAMDESVRIMENIFQDLFSGIVGEADEAWDAIENSFQQMVGRISSTSFRGILDEIQEAFGPGGGGFGSIDFRGVGLQFGQIAASAFADDIVTGIFGNQNTGIDYVEIGKQIGTVVGSIIGSFIPVIGTALGGILGSFAGALDGLIFGKLFGRKAETSIGGVNAPGAGPEDQSIITALGEVFSLHAQGGVGGFLEVGTIGEEIGKAIASLDQAIFDILKSVGGADQLAVIQDALDNWEGTWREGALTIEDILGSRFAVILSTFGDHVQDFVNNTDDIQEQVERFGVALQVDKLFEELPDALGGRTQAEFLSIIEKYKGAFQSMGEAAEEVIDLFVQIAAQIDFLSDFAGSNLASDFDQILTIQGRSLGEALAIANSQLVDALANFDGSVGSLQEISGLVFSIREGELQLLQQIDDVQRGLAARLQTLRDDILGVTAQPKSITETLLDAEGLLRAVQGATSASEVADLGQQFDALIRGLTDEQTALAQSDLLKLVDAFEQLSNLRLEAFRDDALSNSEVIRTAVDDFIARIGDPLDIIAQSLDGESIPEVIGEGLADMNETVGQIGPVVANAITQAFGNVNVTVVVNDASLVNQ